MLRPSRNTLLDWEFQSVCVHCHLRGLPVRSAALSAGIQQRRRHASNVNFASIQQFDARATLATTKSTKAARPTKGPRIKFVASMATAPPPPDALHPIPLKKQRGTTIRDELRSWLITQKISDVPTSASVPREPQDDGLTQNNLTRPEDPNIFLSALPHLEDFNSEAEVYLDGIISMASSSDENYAAGALLTKGDIVMLGLPGFVTAYCLYVGPSKDGSFVFYHPAGVFIPLNSPFYILAHRMKRCFPLAQVDELARYMPPPESRISGKESYIQWAKTHPEAKIPEAISAQAIATFTRVLNATDDFYRQHSTWLDQIHARYCHNTDITYVTLDDVATDLLGQPKNGQEHEPHVLHSIELAMLRSFGFFLGVHQMGPVDQVVGVYPKNLVSSVNRVLECGRAYQEAAALEAGGFTVPRAISGRAQAIESFAERAREHIARIQHLARTSPDGQILAFDPPTDGKEMPNAFIPIPADEDILRVLKLHAYTNSYRSLHSLRATSSLLVRSAGVVEEFKHLPDATAKLLALLGVVSPAQPRMSFDQQVHPPQMALDEQVRIADEQVEAGSSVKEAFDIHDSMQHLRKEWGDLPVFCIDGPGTMEVDDGISIEPIERSDGECWVHGHIAHISSLVRPDSFIGQLAASRLQVCFLIGGRMEMLPRKVAALASMGDGTPVLTFSTRLDKECNILESKIQPHTIRNVRYLTPAQINEEVFGIDQDKDRVNTRSFIMGEKPLFTDYTGRPPTSKPLSEAEKNALRRVYDVSIKLQAHDTNLWHQYDARDMKAMYEPRISVRSKYGSLFASVSAQAISSGPSPYGDPDVHLALPLPRESGLPEPVAKSPSRQLVEQIMILCGRVAGQWARERDIPVVYSGSRPLTDHYEDVVEALRSKALQPELRGSLQRDVSRFFATKRRSSRPTKHKMIGTDAWCRVTSPLRRYFDLASHWQIDAAIRNEAFTANPQAGMSPNGVLPFTSSSLERIVRIGSSRELDQERFLRAEKKHWKLHLIARSTFLNDDRLKIPLRLWVGAEASMDSKGTLAGILSPFDVVARIRADAPGAIDGNKVQAREFWEVEPSYIDSAHTYMVCNPLRRIHEAMRTDEAAGDDMFGSLRR